MTLLLPQSLEPRWGVSGVDFYLSELALVVGRIKLRDSGLAHLFVSTKLSNGAAPDGAGLILASP